MCWCRHPWLSHVHLAERVTRPALPSAVVASSTSHWIYWQCLLWNNLSAHFLSHCYLLLSIGFLPFNHCCCPTEQGKSEPSAVQQDNHSECIMVWSSQESFQTMTYCGLPEHHPVPSFSLKLDHFNQRHFTLSQLLQHFSHFVVWLFVIMKQLTCFAVN